MSEVAVVVVGVEKQEEVAEEVQQGPLRPLLRSVQASPYILRQPPSPLRSC